MDLGFFVNMVYLEPRSILIKTKEMNLRLYIYVLMSVFCMVNLQAQTKRFDTSMKIGRAGYKVYCPNKNLDKNPVTIGAIGFENTARDVSFEVKGKVVKAEVDDLDNDGFPDMVIYVNMPGNKNKVIVIGVGSEENKGFRPIIFPDILDNPKIRTGYAGFDQYYLMEGYLMRKFPLFDTSDTANIKPTGVMRQVQYKVAPDERGQLTFKVIRSYDFNKQ